MNKEKEIEEIAKIIANQRGYGCDSQDCCDMSCQILKCGSRCIPHEYAEIIYNVGYRKQSEGEWMAKEKMIRSITALNYTCSVCGVEGRCTPYCPNCGAKMKGGER